MQNLIYDNIIIDGQTDGQACSLWLTKRTLNRLKAFDSASTVSTSRWFVGSSKIMKLGLHAEKYGRSHGYNLILQYTLA